LGLGIGRPGAVLNRKLWRQAQTDAETGGRVQQAVAAIESRTTGEVDLSPYSDSLLVDGYWRGSAGISAIGETSHAHS